jgi:capsular exopolysaccharide synthesis family protein
VEPKDFFRVLLRRKRTIATALIIVVGWTLFGSMRKTPTYNASCQVLVSAVGNDSSIEKPQSVELYATLSTLKSVIEGPEMAQNVAKFLKVAVTQVYGKVNATLMPGTTIYLLRTTDHNARFVATLCNGYATEFVQLRKDQGKDILNQTEDSLKSDLDDLTIQARQFQDQMGLLDPKSSEYAVALVQRNTVLFQITDKRTRIDKIETQKKLIQSSHAGGQILIPAGAVGIKIGPNVKQAGLVGLIVGLIFGIALAFIREYLDDTLRDKDSIQRDLGVPVLASMPAESGRSADGFVDPSSKAVDSARSLRTNLHSLGFPNELQALVITSTLAKRRSTAVVNLSAAVAEAGRTVLVIGADFRNPRLHEQFGVGNAIGLTSVVRGQMSLDQAVRPVPGLDGVYLLPSGPQVTNPGELLSSDGMEELLHDAREWADAVIIDAPPVLTAADASVLGTLADGVVLVMSTGQTQRQQAVEAKDQLVAAGAQVLGVVLAGVTEQPGGKVLSLGNFRRDDDADDLPPLMPYGAWAGVDFGGPALFDAPAPLGRQVARPRNGIGGGTRKSGARNGNGSRSASGRNGKGNGHRTGNGNGHRTGNGNGNGARARNGSSRTGSGSTYRNGETKSGNGSRTGNGNGGRKTVARNGNGNGHRTGNGNGSSPKVVAAKRTQRRAR